MLLLRTFIFCFLTPGDLRAAQQTPEPIRTLVKHYYVVLTSCLHFQRHAWLVNICIYQSHKINKIPLLSWSFSPGSDQGFSLVKAQFTCYRGLKGVGNLTSTIEIRDKKYDMYKDFWLKIATKNN